MWVGGGFGSEETDERGFACEGGGRELGVGRASREGTRTAGSEMLLDVF